LRGDCNSDGGAKEVPSRRWDGDWCWHAAHQAWGAISLGQPSGGHEIARHRANGGGDLGIRTSRIADDDVSSGTSGIQVFSGADRIGFYKNWCFQTRDRYKNRRPSVRVFRSRFFFFFCPGRTLHLLFPHLFAANCKAVALISGFYTTWAVGSLLLRKNSVGLLSHIVESKVSFSVFH
jgi:hypothetical protein